MDDTNGYRSALAMYGGSFAAGYVIALSGFTWHDAISTISQLINGVPVVGAL